VTFTVLGRSNWVHWLLKALAVLWQEALHAFETAITLYDEGSKACRPPATLVGTAR
jgi:hypothetical protein